MTFDVILVQKVRIVLNVKKVSFAVGYNTVYSFEFAQSYFRPIEI